MKKNIFLTVAIVAVLLSGGLVYGFGGCEPDCGKCHSLEQKEAEQILSKMKVTNAKVTGIKMSPVGGLWEVSFDRQGRRESMYVGFSKNQVVQGAIIDLSGKGNGAAKTPAVKPAAAAQQPKERYLDTSKVPLDNALVLGSGNARQKVLVFTDPDCPYCASLHVELKKVVAQDSDIAFYLKLVPLKIHPDADWKSRSIMCTKSMELLEANFEKRPVPRPACEAAVIDENLKLAAELGITGTPTLVMPDGFVVFGGRNARAILDLVAAHQRKKS